MERGFGPSYAHSVAADYRISALGATVNEALERGDSAKAIWRAVCEEFNLAAALR